MAKQQKGDGFTLFELLIVLTIISVLALIAIPIYQRIDVSTKVSLGISFVQPLRFADDNIFTAGGNWPTGGETAGIPHSNVLPEYIYSIVLARSNNSNSITITYDIQALDNDDTLIMYTVENDGMLEWKCDMGTVSNQFRPANCKM